MQDASDRRPLLTNDIRSIVGAFNGAMIAFDLHGQRSPSPVAATAVPMSVVPTAPNYAGRTYEDYLAANPQANPAAPQAAQKN